MRLAARILAGVGGVSAVIFVILLVRMLTGDDGFFGFPAGLFTLMVLAAIVAMGSLITALVLGVVSKASGSVPPMNQAYPVASAATDPGVEQAVQAVLALAGPSLQMTRTAPDVVKIHLVNVGNDNGRVMRPLTVRVFAEMTLKFDGARRRVKHSMRSYEQAGLMSSTSVHYGRSYESYAGVYLTLDGVVPVKFSTWPVYRAIDQALARVGWR